MSRFKKWFQPKEEEPLPIRDVTLDEVKQATHEFELMLPKGTNRTVLLDEAQKIDLDRLAVHLGVRSTQSFYMSRETFAIMEAKDRDIVYEMDHVQLAVDRYFDKEGKLPLKKYTKTFQVDCAMLFATGYLRELPQHSYYLVDESMIIAREPKEN
ncbi:MULTISPECIES: DUF3939 domain-containing protein [unclassified Exiguobacterium]|uniref:DUF3939 domain-containing protein n=1 Tax=unclassified Exiguobacterium TaxID=2644629 RepID=UPI001BE7C500|nr:MULTISPECIES: DUF3939 domain-containing protein [unclassified Exiguobacterium]